MTAPPLPAGPVIGPMPAARLRAWRWTAWVAGLFALATGLLMFAAHWGAQAEDPLKSPRLAELKEKLLASPADESLKKQIRDLDLLLRQRYFRQLERTRSGVYLLLGGVALFALAALKSTPPRNPVPGMALPDSERNPQSSFPVGPARWAVAASGAAVCGLLFALSLPRGPSLPERAADIDKLLAANAVPAAPVADAAPLEELRRNWPCFRGVDGGVSASTNYPIRWDVKTGAGVRWKVEAPTPGFGSPIIFGNRVLFSGGDAAKREVVCLDLETGKLLWRQEVPSANPNAPQAEVPDSTGYAASTMATDGRRAYAIFANGDLAAFTLDGNPVWAKGLGPLKNTYGHASSLAAWRDRLIVQLDQGEAGDGKSRLLALDGRTGQVVWQKPRQVGGSWASPLVFDAAGRAQIAVLAAPCVISYAAADGAELWRVDCLGGEITPSPVFAAGRLLAASPSEKMVAIRPDGRGDVTKTHVAWSTDENIPDITSPVAGGDLVFTIGGSGLLTCFDAAAGKKQWQHDFEMEYHASPALAGGQVYLFSQKGVAAVVEAARQFKEPFRTEMDDEFHASPAFAGSKVVLRGVKWVWCLERGEGVK